MEVRFEDPKIEDLGKYIDNFGIIKSLKNLLPQCVDGVEYAGLLYKIARPYLRLYDDFVNGDPRVADGLGVFLRYANREATREELREAERKVFKALSTATNLHFDSDDLEKRDAAIGAASAALAACSLSASQTAVEAISCSGYTSDGIHWEEIENMVRDYFLV